MRFVVNGLSPEIIRFPCIIVNDEGKLLID
jgi:hypothetical protein